MLDNLDHLRIAVASQLHRSEIGIGDMASIPGDLGGEADGRIGLGVIGRAAAVGGDFRIVELGEIAAEIGVRRQAIIAAVDFRDGERDPLTGRSGQAALAERAGQVEMPFERLRAGGDGAEHVGCAA